MTVRNKSRGCSGVHLAATNKESFPILRLAYPIGASRMRGWCMHAWKSKHEHLGLSKWRTSLTTVASETTATAKSHFERSRCSQDHLTEECAEMCAGGGSEIGADCQPPAVCCYSCGNAKSRGRDPPNRLVCARQPHAAPSSRGNVPSQRGEWRQGGPS